MAVLDNEVIDQLRHSAAGLLKFDSRHIRHWRDRTPGFDRDLWRNMAEQGWFSIMVPERDGGAGLGIAAAAAVAEQFGRACSPEPFVMAGLAGPLLLARTDNTPLKRELLPRVLAGEKVVALASQAADGRFEPESTTLAAKRRDGTVILSGECRFVTPARADLYLLLARSDEGLLIACADAGLLADYLTEEPAPDGTSSAWLRPAGLRLDDGMVLLAGCAVETAIQNVLDLLIIAQSAELCGLMEQALDMTLEYLRIRRQFNVPIGSFQALQHRAVDLFVQKELARHATAAAVRTAEGAANGKTLSLAASSAKFRAAHAGLLIATQAIQLHGAIGFTDEYDLGLYVNRILRLSASLGNAAEHRRRFDSVSGGVSP